MNSRKQSRKAYFFVVREGRSFHDGAPVLLDSDFDLARHNAATERNNARWSDLEPMQKWTAAIRVDAAHSKALLLLDADKARSLELLDRIYQQVRAGHYNTEIRDRLANFLDIEYHPKVDEQRHALVEVVKALPDRTSTGPIEGWALMALSSYGAQRMYQCNERDEIIRSIIATLPKAVPA